MLKKIGAKILWPKRAFNANIGQLFTLKTEQMNKVIGLLFFCLISTDILAEEMTHNLENTKETRFLNLKDRVIGLGNITQFYQDIQEDKKGKTNDFTFWPYFELRTVHGIYKDFSLSPSLDLAFPKNAETDKIKKFLFWGNFHLEYNISNFVFFIGQGLLMQRTTGQGGKITVENGNSTSEFFVPSYSTTTLNFTTNYGLSYKFYQNFSLSSMVQTYRIYDENRRMFNYTISLHYHFDTEKI